MKVKIISGSNLETVENEANRFLTYYESAQLNYSTCYNPGVGTIHSIVISWEE